MSLSRLVNVFPAFNDDTLVSFLVEANGLGNGDTGAGDKF